MRLVGSIRGRLILAAAVMLVAFMAGTGVVVRQAHSVSVRAAHFARLQSEIYLLLAEAELDSAGTLVMPVAFPEPRLSLPGSGLYASIVNVDRGQEWRSPSAVGVIPPFRRTAAVGEWRQEIVDEPQRSFLALTYGVRWAGRAQAAPLVLSVLEDKAEFDHEIGVFDRTLWTWLGGTALLLLLSQTALLHWGLAPLRRVAHEIRRIEGGEQAEIEGRYPTEIAALTGNLNTLIRQERVRQTRYKEALSFLAHSLKTPLAVMRTALGEPAQLPATVAQQVTRMDDIVQYQLGRAGAGGPARFAPQLPIGPVLDRIRASLEKVYADKALAFSIECPPGLGWRLDEGDAFEIFGNVLDNAAKWARSRVAVAVSASAERLEVRIDDDGAGFSDTGSILQLHVRGDEQVAGHGVGLAVVNALVASHHGQLKLSRADLGGARVEIVLPAG